MDILEDRREFIFLGDDLSTYDLEWLKPLDELILDRRRSVRVVIWQESVIESDDFELGCVERGELGLRDTLVVVENGNLEFRHGECDEEDVEDVGGW
jgi:hypothetical protein